MIIIDKNKIRFERTTDNVDWLYKLICEQLGLKYKEAK